MKAVSRVKSNQIFDRRTTMNKTKRVAWRKHRIKAKKYKEKHKMQAQKPGGSVATSTARR